MLQAVALAELHLTEDHVKESNPKQECAVPQELHSEAELIRVSAIEIEVGLIREAKEGTINQTGVRAGFVWSDAPTHRSCTSTNLLPFQSSPGVSQACVAGTVLEGHRLLDLVVGGLAAGLC